MRNSIDPLTQNRNGHHWIWLNRFDFVFLLDSCLLSVLCLSCTDGPGPQEVSRHYCFRIAKSPSLRNSFITGVLVVPIALTSWTWLITVTTGWARLALLGVLVALTLVICPSPPTPPRDPSSAWSEWPWRRWDQRAPSPTVSTSTPSSQGTARSQSAPPARTRGGGDPDEARWVVRVISALVVVSVTVVEK